MVDVLPSFKTVFSPTDPAILNGVYMSEALNPIFVDNFERDPTLTWQYFGSSTGFFRLYPGKTVEIGFALSVPHKNLAGQGLCHGRIHSGKSGVILAPRRAGFCSEQNGLIRLKELFFRHKPLSPIRISPSHAHCSCNPRGVCWQGSSKKLSKHQSRAPLRV